MPYTLRRSLLLIGLGASAAHSQTPPSAAGPSGRYQPRTDIYAALDSGTQHGKRRRPDGGVSAPQFVGNIYYVGTRTLSSFLVATPQGNILINSTYEWNVLAIKKSVEQLGFQIFRHQDSAGDARARRSSGGRRHGQATQRSAGDGLGQRCAGAAGDHAGRQAASARQDAPCHSDQGRSQRRVLRSC